MSVIWKNNSYLSSIHVFCLWYILAVIANWKHCLFRCITTKGSILGTFNFTIEDDHQGSNDDKILQSAANMCKVHENDSKGRFMNSLYSYLVNLRKSVNVLRIGDAQVIVREVVLLTTDRNLRVKALSQNVPVRELPDFIKWSGLLS